MRANFTGKLGQFLHSIIYKIFPQADICIDNKTRLTTSMSSQAQKIDWQKDGEFSSKCSVDKKRKEENKRQ